MCGCGGGGGRNVNVMQMRRRNMARKNRMINQQNNIENTINQHVVHAAPAPAPVAVQQRKINQRRVARFHINFPRGLLNSNKNYPFLIRRRNW